MFNMKGLGGVLFPKHQPLQSIFPNPSRSTILPPGFVTTTHKVCHIGHLRATCFSHVQLFATPWTVACQAPLSVGFPRQEFWSGLPFLTLGQSSQPRDQTCVSHLAGRFFTTGFTWVTPYGAHTRGEIRCDMTCNTTKHFLTLIAIKV